MPSPTDFSPSASVSSLDVSDALPAETAVPPELLATIERYYDAAPRERTRVEEVGPFTLFVAESGWPYYGRPRLGLDTSASPVSVDDVQRLLERQRELGVPEAIEWVDDNTPGLVDVVRAAGVPVSLCPLLALVGEPVGSTGSARVLDPRVPADLADLASAQAAVAVGFDNAGTAIGAAGLEERDRVLTSRHPVVPESVMASMRAGRFFQAAVYDADDPAAGPVGGGGYVPVDGVAELAGIGVLPAYRRRGLAARVSYVLARHALDHGVHTVFCSAQNDDVARVYSTVGFRRIGTACIAAVPSSS